MYQVYTFPPSHYNSRTLYYMTTISTINLDATDVPSKKVLKRESKKRETEGEKQLKLRTKDIFAKYDKPIPFPVLCKYRSSASNNQEGQASFIVSIVNTKSVNKYITIKQLFFDHQSQLLYMFVYNYKAIQNLTYINCGTDRLLLIYQSLAVFHSPTVKIFNSALSRPPNNQLYMPEYLFYIFYLMLFPM